MLDGSVIFSDLSTERLLFPKLLVFSPSIFPLSPWEEGTDRQKKVGARAEVKEKVCANRRRRRHHLPPPIFL